MRGSFYGVRGLNFGLGVIRLAAQSPNLDLQRTSAGMAEGRSPGLGDIDQIPLLAIEGLVGAIVLCPST